MGAVGDGGTPVMSQLLWSGASGVLTLPIDADTFDLADGPTLATELVSVLVRNVTTK